MRPPSSPQSHLRFPLTGLLGSAASVRVLRALALRGVPMSASQLAKECGLSRRGVHLTLDGLVGQRMVAALGADKARLFQMDERHPLAAGLTALFRQEQERWNGLLQAVRELAALQPAIQAAWCFGSVARGDDTAHSDFDIAAVIADDDQVDAAVEGLRQALHGIEDRFCVAFSVIGLSNADLLRLHRTGDAWWANAVGEARVLKGLGPRQYLETLEQ